MSSCVFTFGESSVWDPKVVREYLDIPEDQLNILRNLPEWSKSRQNDNASRIEKSSCESSQSSHLTSNVTLERNEKLITQKKALFDDSSEIRKNILEGYKLKSSKLFRSFSLFEIDRIGNSSFYSDNLRSTLSVPNICQFAENLHPEITSELRKRDSPDKNLSTLNKNFPGKESEKAYITEKSNKDTLESERNKEKIFSETSKMEVDAQLPITIPNVIKDQVKNNETNTGILIENKIVTQNYASNSPNKESAMLTNSNKFQNGVSGVNIEAAKLTTAVDVNLCGKTMDIVIENKLSKSSNQEESETSKVMKSGSSNVCGMNEPVLDSSENIHTNVDITKDNKEVKTSMNLEEPAKSNKIFDHPESNISKELTALNASLVSSNEPAVKISCDSNLPKAVVENDQHIIPTDVSDNKPFADTLSVKRKLESKSRSKKRRKPGSEERSLKKAGDIRYSNEEIKTMLNIMKQFI